MASYPSQLPGPIWASRSGASQPGFRITPMELGVGRRRRISTAPPYVMSWRWKFSAPEYALFEGWVHHELKGGVELFTMPLPCGTGRIETVTCGFLAPPKESGSPGGSWTVEAEVEIRDYKRLTSAELAELIINWGSGQMEGGVTPPTTITAVGVRDTLGAVIYPRSWGTTKAYNGDSTVNYEQTSSAGNTWRRTYSYASGRCTGISAWVKQ